MSYDKIVEIASEIINNGKIPIENLVMHYTLPAKHHLKLNEDLFIRVNNSMRNFEPSDIIEIEVGGIQFKVELEKNTSENLVD